MSAATRRPLIAGNWKMNGTRASRAVLDDLLDGCGAVSGAADLLVCPPATLLASFAAAIGGRPVALGGQDCHAIAAGAHTGDLSAEMLADAGASYVIAGHSERRTDHGETDAAVRTKAEAARRAGLVAIVCVGETRAERDGGRALQVVAGQLRGSVPPGSASSALVVAYEPVWAIGTGLVPTVRDVAEVHEMIRRELAGLLDAETAAAVRVLYGGSVKPANARELLAIPDVDGALVGGASLVAADFLAIAGACGSA